MGKRDIDNKLTNVTNTAPTKWHEDYQQIS